MISTTRTIILAVVALPFKVLLGEIFAELDVIRSKPLCRRRGDTDKIAEMQSNWGIAIMVMFVEKYCEAKQLSHIVI